LYNSYDSRKIDLVELWSDRLLETLVANPSRLHFGRGLPHGDLQRLFYGLGVRKTPYPNIEEDMEFTIVLIVKQKLEEISTKSETELICSVCTLEINTFLSP
jgi:predicted sugar kinase